jgi:2-C-methyl-D-erythritol 4-phosphate cytidylyltransferase/2-C-methyl-D-erythritol 2,4-cyclodiphosphate synthase
MMTLNQSNVALIVAAGAGARAGGNIPKQFRKINGKPMLRHSYEAFLRADCIDKIVIVIADGQMADAQLALAGLPLPQFVTGCETRRQSVAAGLEFVASTGGAQSVLIHDAARPYLPQTIITKLIAALANHVAAVPALPLVDSIAKGDGVMTATVNRDELRRIQTPQAFRFDAILSAHRVWIGEQEPTDDARMVLAAGGEVAMVQGDEQLAKFTFAEDFVSGIRHAVPMQTYRTGTGFDVHRLADGEELWLCGIKIEHDQGLVGHSDADVALHAVTDAMLGALALGDIGDHFPPTDALWRGASSDQFVTHALHLATEKGYAIGNIDVTIICEVPKIGPHRNIMRVRLAEILKTETENVSVKATTSEKLGFTGRGEGIAAQAIVSFVKQD